MIGQRSEISEGDVQLVKKLYNCEQSIDPLQPTVNPLTTTSIKPPTANPLNPASSINHETTIEPSTTSGFPLQTPGRTFINIFY